MRNIKTKIYKKNDRWLIIAMIFLILVPLQKDIFAKIVTFIAFITAIVSFIFGKEQEELDQKQEKRINELNQKIEDEKKKPIKWGEIP